ALSTAACPTALLIGDLDLADRLVTLLLEHAARYSLGPWSTWGRYFAGRLTLKRGDVTGGLGAMSAALDELRATGFGLRFTAYLGELAEALGFAGRPSDGFATVDEALARCEQRQERWCLPELLRVKGELLARIGTPDAMAAT